MKKKWIALLFCMLFAKEAHAFTVHVDSSEKVGVVVHENSLDVYESVLSAIESAEHFVEICPCMTGGRLLKEILDTLDTRMCVAPDLRAYMIIQPTFIDDEDKANLSFMKEQWPNNFFYVFTGCPPGSSLLSPNVIENHIKLSIVDGKYVFIGGTNFEDFMCTKGDSVPDPVESPRLMISGMRRPRAFRDQDVTICSAKLGTQLRREFHAQYALWTAFAQKPLLNKNVEDFRVLPMPELSVKDAERTYCAALELSEQCVVTELDKIRVIFSGPNEEENTITKEYVRLINQAQRSIKIANMYFIPKDEIIDSLKEACLTRKIPSEIITNGCTENSPDLTAVYAWGNRMNYFYLSYGERPSLWKKFMFSKKQPNPHVSISEYFVLDTQLHKKCMIVDDRFFVIGSYNFGKKSDLFDYESIVVIDSPEVAEKASQIFNKDLSLSKPVTQTEIFDWYFHPVHNLVGHLQINFMPG